MGERRKKPTDEQIEKGLWNESVGPGDYGAADEKYRGAIMDQYRLYVEMADRVSARRGLTNTFFLTLNSLILTAVGIFWGSEQSPSVPAEAIWVLLAAALAQCGAWWMIVRSYRQLNGGKFKVVGLIEKRLPASPYSSAEWKALGEGEDWRLYLPLTHVEQWVPMIFAAVYIAAVLIAV